MKNHAAIAIVAAIVLLGACSRHHGKDEEAAKKPEGHFTIHPFAPTSADPVKRHEEQEAMLEAMIENPAVDVEMFKGEAYRRGVALTKDQIDRKAKEFAAHGMSPGMTAKAAPGAQ